MKSFLGRMNFPRAVILFCSLGSLALGWLVYQRASRLAQIERELRQVEVLLKEMHTDAYLLNDLLRIASAEKFKAQSEPETYIRTIAADDKIKVGQVEFNQSTTTPFRGVEDRVFKVKPQTKTQRYSRLQIGNFLYKLESDSRRVKVTRVRMTPFEKLDPGELGNDAWVFEVELTSRSKLETAPAAPASDA
jgi:hypothetical protein